MEIPALTVMDGPFITILPYAGKDNHYIVYDKIYSVFSQEVGIEYTPPKYSITNWDKMRAHGLKYYPFFNNLEYKYSLYGSRPISLKTKNDGRATKIIKHDYPIDFYSIIEGKFVSAPLIAEIFSKVISGKINISEKSALIGHTGFIGSNIKNEYLFSDYYNADNINNIEGKDYDFVISCANPSARWRANQNPKGDLNNILRYIDCIRKANIKNIVLISTIDVYEDPIGVNEDSDTGSPDHNPYGSNRLFLEKFIMNNFNDYLIVRLPIVYGPYFKKNVIYDALNMHELDKINTETQIQVYNVKHLMKDIQLARDHNIRILNLATFPLKVKEIFKEVFDLELNNHCGSGVNYDMRTKYSNLFGKKREYAYDRPEILADLKNFKAEYHRIA
jgi:nucleoside-diphosphate-sugar epimerase